MRKTPRIESEMVQNFKKFPCRSKQDYLEILNRTFETLRGHECQKSISSSYFIDKKILPIQTLTTEPTKSIIRDKPNSSDSSRPIFYDFIHGLNLQCSFCSSHDVTSVSYLSFVQKYTAMCPKHCAKKRDL